jgi:hypothetical protein
MENNVDVYLGFSDAVKSDFDAFIKMVWMVNSPVKASICEANMREPVNQLIAFSTKWYNLFEEMDAPRKVIMDDPRNDTIYALSLLLTGLVTIIQNIRKFVHAISLNDDDSRKAPDLLRTALELFGARIRGIFEQNEILKSQRLGRVKEPKSQSPALVKESISLLKEAQTRETGLRKDLENVLNVLERIK